MTTSTQNTIQSETEALTVEDRFELALDGLRKDGFKVVLNVEGGMSYQPGEKIAWTDCYPSLTFSREGNPVVGMSDKVADRYAGDKIVKLAFHHIGYMHVTADAIAKHFRAQDFEVHDSMGIHDGVTIMF